MVPLGPERRMALWAPVRKAYAHVGALVLAGGKFLEELLAGSGVGRDAIGLATGPGAQRGVGFFDVDQLAGAEADFREPLQGEFLAWRVAVDQLAEAHANGYLLRRVGRLIRRGIVIDCLGDGDDEPGANGVAGRKDGAAHGGQSGGKEYG